MLWRASSLGDFGLEAADGPVGAIRDCLLDERSWTVRWFAADTGVWLPGRKVLLEAGQVAARAGTASEPPALALGLTHDEVRTSPAAEADPELRSTAELTGFHIHARDGTLGRIDDFLLDRDGWVVRYVVVGTRDWWAGREVLLIPGAITGVRWEERAAEVALTREQVRNAPEFDPGETVDRAFEERYFGYYGYPVYW